MEWLFALLGFILGILLGIFGTVIYFKRGLSSQQKQLQDDIQKAEAENAKLLGEAQKNAESRKRDLLLQAKEEISKARVELERDVRERKQELAKERNRLDQKEETLDKKLSNIEIKESEIENIKKDIYEAACHQNIQGSLRVAYGSEYSGAYIVDKVKYHSHKENAQISYGRVDDVRGCIHKDNNAP